MGKVVIVTGAAGGIGRGVAKRFGSTGAKVVVHYHRAAQFAEDVVKEINEGPGEAFAYRADIRNYEEIKAMIEETVGTWGRIDVLVNCAGGSPRFLGMAEKTIAEMDEETWDTVVDTNLKGTMHCIKAVAPQMMKQRDGYIVNIGARLGARRSRKVSSPYAAARAGLIALTQVAARELGEYNVKVNIIVLGLTLHWKNIQSHSGSAMLQGYIAETALQRSQTAEELADFMVHLSELNNISGQTFYPDSWLGAPA